MYLQKMLLACLVLVLGFTAAWGQIRTVGVIYNSQVSYDGYTLFSPMSSRTTYLIDNCGHEVHRWSSNYNPGLASYLREDGSLVRTARIGSTFNSGGSGGRIEIIGWNGELVWGYNYSTPQYHQHHDVEPLPNGNILVLAWEKITREEAIAAGRNPASITSDVIWPEHIVELRPVGADDAEIVWEWHVMDHVIQDFDSTKANYGVVEDHPELIDMNYLSADGFVLSADWIHANSIDYNEQLDQILISSRNLSELWIIDHSTTTSEAAGHSGGISGKGGDLLFRWGNPEAYKRGNASDRHLYGQHDARWIPEDYPDHGKISIFNNGSNRPGRDFSSIDIIAPDIDDEDGNYPLTQAGRFGPDTLSWTFDGDSDFEFFANNISGTSQLPNGNMLICIGTQGRFVEINTYGDPVWEYINPISAGIPTSQGNPTFSNNVFKIERYSAGYQAFEGRDLTPGDLIEADPFPEECVLFPDTTTSIRDIALPENIRVMGNPVTGVIEISNPDFRQLDIFIYDPGGRIWLSSSSAYDPVVLPVDDFSPGIFFLMISDTQTYQRTTFKVVKL